MVNGHRVRLFRKTKKAAEGEAAKIRIKKENEGGSAFGLSAVKRIDAEAALKQAGVPVETLACPGVEHAIDPEGLQRGGLFLRQVLA